MTTIPIQTPLTKLQADKRSLRKQCKEQEERLNVHFRYVQANAGNLLLAGVSALLSTTGTPKAEKKEAATASSQRITPLARRQAARGVPGLPMGMSALLKVPKLLSLGSGWVPIAWEVAQPLLLTWSIKRVKRIIGGAFTRKKK